MRTYCIVQGTLLSALWRPKQEGNPKRVDICIHLADLLCCIEEISTAFKAIILQLRNKHTMREKATDP